MLKLLMSLRRLQLRVFSQHEKAEFI